MYNSINIYCAVTGEQMGDIIELYTSGKSFEFIATKYKVRVHTIKNYIHHHYYGIIPKYRQKVIVIQSSINE